MISRTTLKENEREFIVKEEGEMTDTKKLLGFLEFIPKVHVDEEYKESFYMTNKSFDNLGKIKRILEQKRQPDEELVQNTYDEIYTHITYDIDMRISIDEDEIKNILRKLLESK